MIISIFVTAVAAFASLVSTGWVGVSEDAAQVIRRWNAPSEAKDLEGYTKHYVPHAPFWGTGSKMVVTSTDEVRRDFERAFSTMGSRKVTGSEQKTHALPVAVVKIATADAVAETRKEKEFASLGRTAWVIAKRDGEWAIIHFHRSSV